MKHIKVSQEIAIIVLVLTILSSLTAVKAQSVHNEQYIALQNWTLPQYKITFGAPITLLTNYTFLLPAAAPTSTNQTLIVISKVDSTYTLGWGTSTAWSLTGNSGTSSLMNYIGTNDLQDFVLKTDSIERMRVTSAGKVIVGTLLNSGQLQLQGTVGSNTFTTGGTQLLNVNYTLPTSAPSLNGQVLSSTTGGVMSWINGGGVTSVGLAMPSIFTVTNSPVTSSGTLTASLNTQSANLVFAGPSSGVPAVPTFRTLTPSDVPTLPYVSSVGLALPTNEFTVSGSPVTSSGTLTGSWKTQSANRFFGGPSSGAAATPTFRALSPIDIPTLPYVSSVGLAMPSIFSVSGSPVTTSGTLTASLINETANTVFAGPSSGGAGVPTFRTLVINDIPDLSGSYIDNGTAVQTSSNFHISDTGKIEKQLQLKGTSTGWTTFAAGAQGTTNINYTLPIAQGAAGTVLGNNGSGVLSWVDESSTVGAVKFAIKGSDESVSNSSTLQNDDDLSFTIGANETWELVAQLDTYTASEDGDAPNIKIAVTIPSGTLHVFAYGNGGTDINGNWLKTSGTANTNSFEVTDEDEFGPVVLEGLIVGGSTGGTVHIQWAPSSSSANAITVRKNSYLKATRAN